MYVLVIGAILLVGVASMFGSINLTIASGEKFLCIISAILTKNT